MYTRKEVDQARRDLAEDPEWRRPVHPVVDTDAPYIGPGPLYVWVGDHWLAWNQWIATVAIEREEPAAVPHHSVAVPKKQKRKKKNDGILPLFDGDGTGRAAGSGGSDQAG